MILDEFEKQCKGFRDSKQFSLADIEKILGEMKCGNCKHYSYCLNNITNLTNQREVIRLTFCSQFEVKE